MSVTIKRVCTPTDFSEPSEQAVRYGAGIAEQYGAELHLLHVLHDFGEAVMHPDMTAHGELARRYFNELEAKITGEAPQEDEDAAAQRYLKGLELGAESEFKALESKPWWERVSVTRVLRYGKPVPEICDYVNKNGIDLVVVGTHGRSGITQFLLGSVAEKLIRVCPCPVLTVRTHEREFVHD